MKIAICNEKGGSGKSTLAVNLAICANKLDNKQNLVVDTDPQKSIVTFLNIRNEENNEKAFDFVYKYSEELKSFLSTTKHENIIIDTGGRDSKEMRIAISKADLVVIPTIPSQFDVAVLDKMIEIIKMAQELNTKLKALIVINRASWLKQLNAKIENLKKYIQGLEQKNIKLANNIIYDREQYKLATQLGLGVIEMKNQKCKNEMINLYNEINEFIKM